MTFSLVFPMEKKPTKVALFSLAKQGRFSSAISVFAIKIRFCVYLGSTTKSNRKEKALTNTPAVVSPPPAPALRHLVLLYTAPRVLLGNHPLSCSTVRFVLRVFLHRAEK